MIQPTDNNVAIIRDASPTQQVSDGGIHLPTNPNTAPRVTGVVKALGPQVGDNIKVGQQVMFAPHAGQEITLDGQTYLIIQQSYILAILG